MRHPSQRVALVVNMMIAIIVKKLLSMIMQAHVNQIQPTGVLVVKLIVLSPKNSGQDGWELLQKHTFITTRVVVEESFTFRPLSCHSNIHQFLHQLPEAF